MCIVPIPKFSRSLLLALSRTCDTSTWATGTEYGRLLSYLVMSWPLLFCPVRSGLASLPDNAPTTDVFLMRAMFPPHDPRSHTLFVLLLSWFRLLHLVARCWKTPGDTEDGIFDPRVHRSQALNVCRDAPPRRPKLQCWIFCEPSSAFFLQGFNFEIRGRGGVLKSTLGSIFPSSVRK